MVIMASLQNDMLRTFARRLWLMNQRRGLKTSEQRCCEGFMQPRVFREVRDLGFAPKFKDETIKRGLRNPYWSKRDWWKHSKHAPTLAFFYGVYKVHQKEAELKEYDMGLLKDSVYIPHDNALMDKYEVMFAQEIDRVFAEKEVPKALGI